MKPMRVSEALFTCVEHPECPPEIAQILRDCAYDVQKMEIDTARRGAPKGIGHPSYPYIGPDLTVVR